MKMNRYLIHISIFLYSTICQFFCLFGSVEFHEKFIEIYPKKNIRIISTMPYTDFNSQKTIPKMSSESLQEVISHVPKFGFKISLNGESNPPIFFILGRTMFGELVTSFIEACSQNKMPVITYDHPGQGDSFRTIDPCQTTHCNFDTGKIDLCDRCQRGHIDSYDEYVEALRYVLVSTTAAYNDYNKDIQEDQLAFDFPKKFRIMAHSMGSTVWLMFIHKYHHIAKCCVEDVTLVSPMIRFITLPYSYNFTKIFSWVMSRFKYTSQEYILGHTSFSKDKNISFDKNKNIKEEKDYKKIEKLYLSHPKKIVWGATFGWLNASHLALEILLKQFEKSKMRDLMTIVFIPTDEQLLDNVETRSFFSGHAPIFEIDGKHNLINETKGIKMILQCMVKYPARSMLRLDGYPKNCLQIPLKNESK